MDTCGAVKVFPSTSLMGQSIVLLVVCMLEWIRAVCRQWVCLFLLLDIHEYIYMWV